MDNFLQPSNSAVPLSMAANRTASSTLASLSRYFLHQRWVWAVQSSQGPAVAMQAVAHILSMLSEWVDAHFVGTTLKLVLSVSWLKYSVLKNYSYP